MWLANMHILYFFPEINVIHGARTIGMLTIGMEDNWHAENWHGGQLALTFLNYCGSYSITLFIYFHIYIA